MNQNTARDPSSFADRLSAMTDDELFDTLRGLDRKSAAHSSQAVTDDPLFSDITLVTTEIENRFPGQALAPYKEWQRRNVV